VIEAFDTLTRVSTALERSIQLTADMAETTGWQTQATAKALGWQSIHNPHTVNTCGCLSAFGTAILASGTNILDISCPTAQVINEAYQHLAKWTIEHPERAVNPDMQGL
jgi:hypothetical protein